ncbi:o-succinylbenzoate--CoA ligase [Shewanella intestini]|uniref:O-succinylbenzoate--CoA ligase n=2 Tax=Shewanellaceae TaxID=267890 RepID=A0ABS5I3Z3_9GAMM|nr:o-succinylbenzoate--CoA ligase [Shewanella intestini]MRG36817.1 o-succinylbenzoate--CoA ligase [Shewanella sp. XMDDZSB0408]
MISPLHNTAQQHPLQTAIRLLVRANETTDLSTGNHTQLAASTQANSATKTQTAITTNPAHSAIRPLDISYQQLSLHVSQLAQTLTNSGIKQGDIIAAVASDNVALIHLYWACVDLGCLFFPISARFSAYKVAELLNQHNVAFVYSDIKDFDQQLSTAIMAVKPLDNAKSIIQVINKINWLDLSAYDIAAQKLTTAKLTPSADAQSLPAPTIDINAPQNIILTSGSSGHPKSAVHSLANHIHSANGASSRIALNQGDSWLLSLPLFHIGGLAIINRCALNAAAMVIQQAKCSLSDYLEHAQVTHLSLVPTQARQLLNEALASLSHVKAVLLGGGIIDNQLVHSFLQADIPAFSSYGMTEMSSQITTSHANTLGHHGAVLPHRQLKVVDGMIWLKGECLFLGYLADGKIQRPLDSQGWFCSNDLGALDENQQLTVLGRADNMFICGGENIQPEEIESMLLRHQNVKQALVFGINDQKFGLLPAAVIDYVDGNLAGDTNQALTDMICSQLARFKRPRQYFLWPHNLPQAGLKVSRQQVINALPQQ